MDYDNLDDNDLFLLFKEKKDTDALNELFQRNVDLAYRIALQYSYNKSDAEDIVQNSFLALMAHKGDYQNQHKFTGWLISIIINHCRNLNRTENRMKERHKKKASERLSEKKTTDLSVEPEENKMKSVMASINKLPGKYKMALSLRYFENCSFQDIAVALSLKESTVRKQISRGLEMVRKELRLSNIVIASVALEAILSSQPLQAAPKNLSVTLENLAHSNSDVLSSVALSQTATGISLLAKVLLLSSLVIATGVGYYHFNKTEELSLSTTKIKMTSVEKNPFVAKGAIFTNLMQDERKVGSNIQMYVTKEQKKRGIRFTSKFDKSLWRIISSADKTQIRLNPKDNFTHQIYFNQPILRPISILIKVKSDSKSKNKFFAFCATTQKKDRIRQFAHYALMDFPTEYRVDLFHYQGKVVALVEKFFGANYFTYIGVLKEVDYLNFGLSGNFPFDATISYKYFPEYVDPTKTALWVKYNVTEELKKKSIVAPMTKNNLAD